MSEWIFTDGQTKVQMREGEPEASLPRLSPTSAPPQCHTPHPAPTWSLRAHQAPGILPRGPQRSLHPSFDSTIMSLFAVTRVEPLTSTPIPFVFREVLPTHGAPTSEEMGLSELQGGWGHSLEKPGGTEYQNGKEDSGHLVQHQLSFPASVQIQT